MKPKNTKADRIRTMLRGRTKGMSAQMIADHFDLESGYVRVLLTQMPDTYIESWDRTKSGRGYLAIWNVAYLPPDALRPKSAPVERRVYDAKYRQRMRRIKVPDVIEPVKDIEPIEPVQIVEPVEIIEPVKLEVAVEAPAIQSTGPKTRWVTPPPWAN